MQKLDTIYISSVTKKTTNVPHRTLLHGRYKIEILALCQNWVFITHEKKNQNILASEWEKERESPNIHLW